MSSSGSCRSVAQRWQYILLEQIYKSVLSTFPDTATQEKEDLFLAQFQEGHRNQSRFVLNSRTRKEQHSISWQLRKLNPTPRDTHSARQASATEGSTDSQNSPTSQNQMFAYISLSETFHIRTIKCLLPRLKFSQAAVTGWQDDRQKEDMLSISAMGWS